MVIMVISLFWTKFMTTCKHFSSTSQHVKESVFLNGGLELLRCNTTQSWRRNGDKTVSENKICNLTFISKFQGLVVWKSKSVAFSSLHWRLFLLLSVTVFVCSSKAWWANVPFPQRCASIHRVLAPLYNVFISGPENCAWVRYIRDLGRLGSESRL